MFVGCLDLAKVKILRFTQDKAFARSMVQTGGNTVQKFVY